MFNLVPDIITEYWLGNEDKKKKESKPAEEFKKFCESEPWAPECKEYDV
jgi:hypothetical protein